MPATTVQVAVCAALLTGVMSLPFASEDEANQFLRLKRQIPYSDYWDPSSSQNTWGVTLAEQASESWTVLRATVQYYVDVGPFAYNADTARTIMGMKDVSATFPIRDIHEYLAQSKFEQICTGNTLTFK